MVSDFYQKLANTSFENIKKSKKKLLVIQILRVLIFSGFFTFLILFLSDSYIYLYFSGISLLGFIVLINTSTKFKNRSDLFKRVNEVSKRELRIINNDIPAVKSQFDKIESNHAFAFDLDVLGDNSLFSRLNRTSSKISESLLLDSVTNLTKDINKIYKRQNSIDELSKKISQVVEFNAIALTYFESQSEVSLISKVLIDRSKKIGWTLTFSAIVLSLGTVIALSLAIYQALPHQYWIILVAINLILTYWVEQKKSDKILTLNSSITIIQKYQELATHINKFDFKDPQLKSFSSNFAKHSTSLAKLTSILNFQKSSNFITNGFFLLDIHVIKKVESIKIKSVMDFEDVVLNICQIEELISLAFFKFNNPSYTFPSISDKAGVLNFDKLGHPFVLTENCVTNEFYKEANINIITGSNMSGKSTFLRSIGINFVLAHIGAPVFASSFETSVGNLFTSIKTVDSLNEQKSFFYAEVLRLSEIQKNINDENWALVLLDETLKGTNSDDKLSGSISLTTKFSKLNCTLFFSTHDSKMGILEEQNKDIFRNYCFESEVVNNEVIYDFILREGITSSKNATFLLKRHGVID